MVGGATSLLVLRLMGQIVDRAGPIWTLAGGSLGTIAVILAGFAFGPMLHPMVMFIGFMGFQSARQISLQTLSSLVPGPAERARYQSAHSAAQHLCSAAGAGLGSVLLSEGPGRVLVGMGRVSAVACGMALMVVPLAAWLYGRVRPGAAR